MVTRYGIREALGLRTFEAERRSAFRDAPVMPRNEHSEERTRAIDAEVEKILARSHDRVRHMLTERRAVLDNVAHRLLEKEVMEGDELRALLAGTVSVRRAAV